MGLGGNILKLLEISRTAEKIDTFFYPSPNPPLPNWCGVGYGSKLEGVRDGLEGGTDGREGRRDVMAIMKSVHMAWNGCIIVNPSEAE